MIYQATPNVTPTGSSYNDGSGVYGSAQLTFNGTATYDTNDFTPDYSTNRKEQTNRFGVPVKAFAIPNVPNGSCNVIIPANNSSLPVPGNTFVADVTGSVTWLVDKIGLPFKKDDFFITPVDYHQKLN